MDKLPLELLNQVVADLPPTEKLATALVCTRFLDHLRDDLPPPTEFNVCLVHSASSGCRGVVKCDRGGWSAAVCECPDHGGAKQLDVLCELIAEGLEEILLEDELLMDNDFAHSKIKRLRFDENIEEIKMRRHISGAASRVLVDATIYSLLSRVAPTRLNVLRMNRVSLSKPWTAALLARLESLKEFHLDSCTLGFPEGLLTRSLAPSFNTLTQIVIKDCPQLTDKLARDTAKLAVNLEVFDVAGCPRVTVQSIFPFMEATALRRAQQLTINVQHTGFKPQQLASSIQSPLLSGGRDWRLVPMVVSLGYEKPALLLENRYLDGKCILIYF